MELNKWIFWESLLWGIALIIVFVGLQTAAYFIFVDYLSSVPEQDLAFYDGDLMAFMGLAPLPVMLLVFWAISKTKQGSFKEIYSLHKVKKTALFKWSLVVIALHLIVAVFFFVFDVPLPPYMVEVYTTADYFWLVVVAVVIAAPIIEEFNFRGVILSGFEVKFGFVPAMIIVSSIFALIHEQYQWEYLIWVFILALIVSIAKKQTGTLLVPIYLHALANVLATIDLILYMRFIY